MIQVEKLTKTFSGCPVFHDVDLTIRDGEVVGIIGPSGTGKSTFLRCLMMLERPDSGRVLLDGEELTAADSDLNAARKRIGMVFQNFNLFEHLSVIENVMSGMVHLQAIDPQTAYDEAMELIRTVGLADKAFAYPRTLAGGEKQRAAIARTLAMKPEIILLDEPTSALDPMSRGEVEAVIRMMAARGHTMVIVTHEMELARQICTRIVYVDGGEICEEGTPAQIFDHPEHTSTRRFVRALRVLEFDVQSRGFDFIGSQTTIAEFAYRNGVPKPLLDRMQSIIEELFQMVIIQPAEENQMHISFEYNNRETSVSGVVRFSGPPIDPDDPLLFFSWPIIVKRASEISVEQVQDGKFTNRVSIVIR